MKSISFTLASTVIAAVISTTALPAFAQDAAAKPSATETAAQMAKPNAQMQAVLDALKALQVKPLHELSVPDARNQASPADAARTVQRDKRISPYPEAAVMTKDIGIVGPMGTLSARVYTPEGTGPFPVIVYFHGGGWVVADINTYDATPRAMVLGADAIVVSVEYRHAPEFKFPAAHDDAWTAYAWVVENAQTINGDASKVAVAGESAGANLAANVALEAKERKATLPVYQALIYPVAGTDMNTPSYLENADATPLGKADMAWFFDKVLESKDQMSDPRLDLVHRTDLEGLPPTTVITAQIDPLRSEGQAFAENLKAAGVTVDAVNFDGVTHEFFGMAKVVDDAKKAMDTVNADLKAAFAK